MMLLVISLHTSLPAFAQGIVVFKNGGLTFKTRADRRVYVGGDWLVGTNYVAALYYIPGADQNILSATNGTLAYGNDGLSLAYFRPQTTTGPGVWMNASAGVGNLRTLVGVVEGQTATLQVRVWDLDQYATFAEAFAAGAYGWSQPFNFTVPPPPDPYSIPWDTYMDGLRSFTCVFPPPPPTLVLQRTSPVPFTISWWPTSTGYILQENTTLDPLGWTDAPSGTTNPVAVPMEDTRLFRLRKP